MKMRDRLLELQKQSELEIGFTEPRPNSYKLLLNSFNLKELPTEFVGLLEISNGLKLMMNSNVVGNLIWSVEEIVKLNEEYRSNQEFKKLYMSFDQLLFFSDAGNGDLFGFIILNGEFPRYLSSINKKENL